jgi:hypothetical protein
LYGYQGIPYSKSLKKRQAYKRLEIFWLGVEKIYVEDMTTNRGQAAICPCCVSIEWHIGAVRWHLQDLAFL